MNREDMNQSVPTINPPPGTRRSDTLRAGALFIVLLLGVAGCGGSAGLTSAWPDTPPPVDGTRNAAWGSVMKVLPEQDMMVGLMNDSAYLYLSMVTDDRTLQRQVLMMGLTAWFDREGGNEKRFGVHYPIGGSPPVGGFGRRGGGRSEGGGDDTGDDTGDDDVDAGQPGGEYGGEMRGGEFRRPTFDSTEIEIFGPFPGDHERFTMIYQARIPLRDRGANPYAIGTGPGALIGVGLETGSRPPERGPGTGMAPPDMSPGGGGGYGGGGRGGMRLPSGFRTEPLDFWGKVQLAGPPIGSP